MTPEQTRIRAIIASADGQAMPAMAQNLAFETEMTAEAAIGLLAAARADQTAAAPPAATTTEQPSQPFLVNTAGGNGLAVPQPTSLSDGAQAGWSKAVAAANASLGIAN